MIRACPRHQRSIDTFFPANTRGAIHVGNLRAERARALAASSSRFLGGACVSSEIRSFLESAAISSTAARNATSFAFDGLLKPLSFLTNCSEAARISSSVTGGSKLKSVLMFLHIKVISIFPRAPKCMKRLQIKVEYSQLYEMAAAFGVRALGILLANSGVRRMGGGNVRQTSVCRWLPPLAHCRKPRQTEVCRTFSEFAISISPRRTPLHTLRDY